MIENSTKNKNIKKAWLCETDLWSRERIKSANKQ